MINRRQTARSGVFIATLSVLAAATLSGCTSGGDTDNGVVKLTFANFYTGPDIKTIDKMVDAFNEAHDHIQVTNQAILGDTLTQELPNLVAAGKAPDIEAMQEISMPLASAQGALQPLTDDDLKTMKVGKSDFLENIWDLGTNGDSVYGIPFGAASTGIFYNKTLMSEKGVSAVPTNLDEMVEAGTKCTVDNAGRTPGTDGFDTGSLATYGYGIPVEWGALIGDSVLAQNGGALYDDDFNPSFDSPEGLETLELLSSLTTDVPIGPPGIGFEADLANFKAGKSCFVQAGVWELAGMQASDIDFGFAVTPQLGSEKSATWGGAAWLSLPKQPDSYSDEKRAAALEFIGWFTSAEGSLMWTESGNLPVRPDVAESPEYEDNPAAPIAQSLENAYVPSGFPWVAQINAGWASAFSAVMSGASTPADALKKAAAETESNVKDARANFPEFTG